MDWLIFGDDYGAHPSTTQHLVTRLPAGDRVVWVDSIGMRRPRLNRADVARVTGRLQRVIQRGAAPRTRAPAPTERRIAVVRPLTLPWHDVSPARWVNRATLQRSIRQKLEALGITRVNAVLANPLALPYLAGLPVDRVGYLRLDDYARLPGVDADLVAPADARLIAEADLVFGTAKKLLPPATASRRAPVYLPQGVDTAHFAAVPFRGDGPRVLGFFGLLAEWLDSALVGAVADANPDWTLEFRGPVRTFDPALAARPNIRLVPGVPYDALPATLGSWWAAWIPFAINELTLAVNPLKVREYLAAGLPTASTPLPEVVALGKDVHVTPTAEAVSEFLVHAASDSPAQRAARRALVSTHDWGARAADLRRAFEGLG